jgi:hypothetical protein
MYRAVNIQYEHSDRVRSLTIGIVLPGVICQYEGPEHRSRRGIGLTKRSDRLTLELLLSRDLN